MIWVHLNKVIKDLWNQLFSMSRWNQKLRKHLYEGSDQFDRIMNFWKTFWSFCATAKWAERKHAQSTTSLPIFLLIGFNSGCSWCWNTVFLLCEVRRTNELPMRIADSEDTLPAILVAPKKRKMQLLAMVKDNVVEVAPRNCLYKDVEEKTHKVLTFHQVLYAFYGFAKTTL